MCVNCNHHSWNPPKFTYQIDRGDWTHSSSEEKHVTWQFFFLDQQLLSCFLMPTEAWETLAIPHSNQTMLVTINKPCYQFETTPPGYLIGVDMYGRVVFSNMYIHYLASVEENFLCWKNSTIFMNVSCLSYGSNISLMKNVICDIKKSNICNECVSQTE